MNSTKWENRSPREAVLGVLGTITLGVAVLSVYVSYQILEPRFGWWAVPVVGALDALWLVFQMTEILAGSNRRRSLRVMGAGLVLTLINAAIPTADLVITGGVDLAVILTPVAIVLTKFAWWLVLPSLGRRMSPETRQRIEAERQRVADRLEEMEAEAAQRVELLNVARTLERQVGKAETAYRKSRLKAQQKAVQTLHDQAESTQKTVEEKVLPASVAAISLPDLDTWTPTVPALPGTLPGTELVAGHTAGTQVSGLDGETGTAAGTAGVPQDGEPARPPVRPELLTELATVARVPVPEPGVALTDEQLAVVLRALRYDSELEMSYRQARDVFRAAGFIGSEDRIRKTWAALRKNEGLDDAETSEDAEGENEDMDA